MIGQASAIVPIAEAVIVTFKTPLNVLLSAAKFAVPFATMVAVMVTPGAAVKGTLGIVWSMVMVEPLTVAAKFTGAPKTETPTVTSETVPPALS